MRNRSTRVCSRETIRRALPAQPKRLSQLSASQSTAEKAIDKHPRDRIDEGRTG